MPASRHPRRLPPRRAVADAPRFADEADPIAELRAIVAALETPADRLLARYCGRSFGRPRGFAVHGASHR